MDDSVLAALERWPDVPAVYDWLSLDARERWRLHPNGDASLGGVGDAITNVQIIAFIGRNYANDGDGSWYFQNGPQRVYVRLDAAPYILRLSQEGIALETHTGLPVHAVSQWLLDDEGNLYAATEHGPALMNDRDLTTVLELLHVADGRSLMKRLEDEIEKCSAAAFESSVDLAVSAATRCRSPFAVVAITDVMPPAPFMRVSSARVAQQLRFNKNPAPSP